MKRNNLLPLLGALACVACSEVTLAPPPEKATVTLRMDWQGQKAPQAMKAYFYSVENPAALPVTAEGTGTEVVGQLLEGNYRALTYNTDATGLVVSGLNSYQSAMVSAQAATRAGTGGYLTQPSTFYACGLREELVASPIDPLEIPTLPSQLTRTLKFHIQLSAIEGVDALVGSLNGVYSALSLSTGEPTPESVSNAPVMRSSFRVEKPGKQVAIDFHSLGILNPEGGKKYRCVMEISLLGNDGWRQDTPVDLTDVLTEIIGSNNGDLPIEIPVEVEMEVTQVETGLRASVKGWKQGTGEGDIYE